MASVSVLPPSTNGTTNDYGGVTGLTVVRSETTNPVTTQTGTNFSAAFSLAANTGPALAGAPSMTQSGYNIGLTGSGNTAGTGIYGCISACLTQMGATNVSVGSNAFTTFRTTAIYTSNPGTTLTFQVPIFIQNFGVDLYGSTATVQYVSAVNTTTQVTVAVYTFTNNTGDSVTVEGTTITNGSTLAVALIGQYFNIIYTEPASEDPYQEEEQEEQTEEESTEETVTITAPVIAPTYVYATGATGFGVGLTGYFYPLYTDINAAALSGGYHIHTFTEYEGYTFYMPNGSMNHAVSSRPTGINLYITGNTALDNLEPTGVSNPDYATLLPQIASETNITEKQRLIDQTYQFNSPLSQGEEDLFAYINSGYIQDNPNATDGTPDVFISYVGIYYDQFGRNTATVGAQQNVVIQGTTGTQGTTSGIDGQGTTSGTGGQGTTGAVAEYGTAEYGIAEYGA